MNHELETWKERQTAWAAEQRLKQNTKTITYLNASQIDTIAELSREIKELKESTIKVSELREFIEECKSYDIAKNSTGTQLGYHWGLNEILLKFCKGAK